MNHQLPHDSAEGFDQRRVSELAGRRTANSRVRRPAFRLRRTLSADHGAGRMSRVQAKAMEGARSRLLPKCGWSLASDFTPQM